MKVGGVSESALSRHSVGAELVISTHPAKTAGL
jgi:hypothetical protein